MVQKLAKSGAPFKIFIFEKTIHVRKKRYQGFRSFFPSQIQLGDHSLTPCRYGGYKIGI
jgi:hypothetical protein